MIEKKVCKGCGKMYGRKFTTTQKQTVKAFLKSSYCSTRCSSTATAVARAKRHREALLGKTFSKLTITGFIKVDDRPKYHRYDAVCVCVCGSVVHVRVQHLREGAAGKKGITSCGGSFCTTSRWGSAKDIEGQRFGRLRAIRPVKTDRERLGKWWECVCDCGAKKLALCGNLTKGGVRTCGKLACKRELGRATRAKRKALTFQEAA